MTSDNPPCIQCGQVAKKPANSRRPRTGLVRGLCSTCYAKAHAKGTLDDVALPVAKPYERPLWSKEISKTGYVTIKTPRGLMHEHRWVMEQHLGRELINGESIHHVNGDRCDNRLENLELWASKHPGGQRTVDLIAYVIEHHREAVIAALGKVA